MLFTEQFKLICMTTTIRNMLIYVITFLALDFVSKGLDEYSCILPL